LERRVHLTPSGGGPNVGCAPTPDFHFRTGTPHTERGWPTFLDFSTADNDHRNCTTDYSATSTHPSPMPRQPSHHADEFRHRTSEPSNLLATTSPHLIHRLPTHVRTPPTLCSTVNWNPPTSSMTTTDLHHSPTSRFTSDVPPQAPCQLRALRLASNIQSRSSTDTTQVDEDVNI